jgi:hypothetical protein
MTRSFNLILLVIIFALLSGCAGIVAAPGTTEKELVERDGVDVALIPAAYREVYFSQTTSEDRHCRAPDPDFTVQQSDQLNISLPIDGEDSVGGGETQSSMNLGGRTPTVLLTRELMYRACELAVNTNANQETSIAIYDKFLNVIMVLAHGGFEQTEDSESSP